MSAIKFRIGVSSCLLGQNVRYDGGHRRNDYIVDTLGEIFDLVAVCPETELGMPTPRETIQLEGDVERPDLRSTSTRQDWTSPMAAWSRKRILELKDEALAGFIFKKNSPSCGLFKVPVIQTDGSEILGGRGMFAAEFTRAFPDIPVEDAQRLADTEIRDEFLARVQAFYRQSTAE